jgi:hypothetical protein
LIIVSTETSDYIAILLRDLQKNNIPTKREEAGWFHTPKEKLRSPIVWCL